MTLLERFDQYDFRGINIKKDEVRRAIAIAQAVEEMRAIATKLQVLPTLHEMNGILRRADELLRGGSKDPRKENSAYGAWLRGEP